MVIVGLKKIKINSIENFTGLLDKVRQAALQATLA
jgi:hypothetical protein